MFNSPMTIEIIRNNTEKEEKTVTKHIEK